MFILPNGDVVILNGDTIYIVDPPVGKLKGGPSPRAGEGTPAEGIAWEYPWMAAPVMLVTDPMVGEQQHATFEFIVFGGHFPDKNPDPYTDASKYSMRIKLTLSPGEVYTLGDWEIEEMPGPRTITDAVLLPNNKIVVINGIQVCCRLVV